MSSHIEIAKKVIDQEILGLKALEDSLDDNFVNAIELISKVEGKVIISGMGKSGHIGKKIAATLASTGTSSFFVHPGEASHGDLGMITKNDVVILLSNSGETKELTDIINYCKRFAIPMIGIVRRRSSSLVDASDIALVLPDIAEANNVNAPTTSTTMMMALADAIAVCLLSLKGFSKNDFGVFHPGGKLGSAFLTVGKLMHKGKEVPMVDLNSKMSDSLIEMSSKGLGCVAVTDGNKLVGIITDGDLRRHMSPNLTELQSSDIMTENPILILENKLASNAIQIMEENSITSIFVIDEEKNLKGVIHIHDLLRAGVV